MGARPLSLSQWDAHKFLLMSFLQPVFQHWPVDLRQDVASNFHDQIGPDAEYTGVKGGMVDFAHCHSIGNIGRALLVRIRDDMGGIQQLPMLQVAHGTPSVIGLYNAGTKQSLMKPRPGEPRAVPFSDLEFLRIQVITV
ncbi:hypothetical protein StoSoilB20_11960 [Arthrobacter sp. StoSoilB20]|nr:hypothetical protein StoSoilB20_11960 [Arthrobacter sp. StoSoilB20]